VCTETSSILIAGPNRLNVNGDGRAALLLPDPVRLAIQVIDRQIESCRRLKRQIGGRGAAQDPLHVTRERAIERNFGKGEWDIAIGPRVLAPADQADSTADLWVISLVYVAAPGKEFPDIASVDKAGVKIGTIRGAPSDRVLTREIKAAEIVRIPLSPTIATDAAELLRSGKADIFGADSGVGYPAAEALPGAKILPGDFAMVRVAAACRKTALPRRRLHSRHSSTKQSRAAWSRRRSTRKASRA
jgi:hypothetical protein